MNFNLISKNKNGELQVSFTWICVLIVFIGFLFGFGFYFAETLMKYTFTNDGYYVFYYLNKYKIGIILFIIIGLVFKLSKENK